MFDPEAGRFEVLQERWNRAIDRFKDIQRRIFAGEGEAVSLEEFRYWQRVIIAIAEYESNLEAETGL